MPYLSMRLVSVFCPMYLCFLAPMTALSQPLWQKAEVGMTLEQVLHLYPDAHFEKDGDELLTGLEERAKIENYQLFTNFYTVGFYFGNRGLGQVMLSLSGHENSDELNSAFEQLVSGLRGKYGAETFLKKTESSIVRSYDAIWFANGIRISIFGFVIGDDDPGLLNLNYQAAQGQELDKL